MTYSSPIYGPCISNLGIELPHEDFMPFTQVTGAKVFPDNNDKIIIIITIIIIIII